MSPAAYTPTAVTFPPPAASHQDPVPRRVALPLSLGLGAFVGMLLGAAGLRAQWPWSDPAWTFWSVFGELATMPVTGYGGVGMVIALPLLAAALASLYYSRRAHPIVAAAAAPVVSAATGFLWMRLGDLVASLGV